MDGRSGLVLSPLSLLLAGKLPPVLVSVLPRPEVRIPAGAPAIGFPGTGIGLVLDKLLDKLLRRGELDLLRGDREDDDLTNATGSPQLQSSSILSSFATN